MEEWRLLNLETPDDAAMNLAIEEAVFIEKMKKTVTPTLRFWRNKSAVVIGYSQNVEAEVNTGLCEARGIQIVRRFTGGGAVYHDLGNLNYSIAIESDHPLLKGLDITETYQLFSSGIIEGLKTFGIKSLFDPPSDISIKKKKISGNAQSRKKGVIFHHGTLLVKTDLDLLTKVLDAREDARGGKKITSKKRPVANLEDEVGYYLEMNRVKEAIRTGFVRFLSVKLITGALTQEEQETAGRLHAERYSRREWNFLR